MVEELSVGDRGVCENTLGGCGVFSGTLALPEGLIQVALKVCEML